MSRKKSIRDIDVFDLPSEAPETSTIAIDSELYGAIARVDANRQSASPVDIFAIMPDARQPRRAIPYPVRQRWNGDPKQMEMMFSVWVEMIHDERENHGKAIFSDANGFSTEKAQDFNLAIYLDAENDIKRPDFVGPLEETLLTLVELAVSIYKEGLTNAITVAPIGLKYQLETGERRWLAYHLLYLHTQDEKYSRIAARTVEQVSLWRQAAENSARLNLNAVSRARQFSVLLMDLLVQKRGEAFTPIDRFEREQLFYAQVANGDQYRIPRNTSERLLAALGLKNEKQLRDYRRLLELPEIVWQIADDLNWTEYSLREMRDQAGNSPAKLISMAIEKARKVGYSVPVGAVSESIPTKEAKLEDDLFEDEIFAPGSKKYYAQMTRLLGKSGYGKNKANREALEMVQDFKHWLDEQEHVLRGYLDK
jgi:hypothetical protein